MEVMLLSSTAASPWVRGLQRAAVTWVLYSPGFHLWLAGVRHSLMGRANHLGSKWLKISLFGLYSKQMDM